MKSVRFGYFENASDEHPTYDPQKKHGFRVCPVCLKKIHKGEKNITTVSFRSIDEKEPKSFFYTIHKKCRDPEKERYIEGGCLEDL